MAAAPLSIQNKSDTHLADAVVDPYRSVNQTAVGHVGWVFDSPWSNSSDASVSLVLDEGC